jgi:hypothetical protein
METQLKTLRSIHRIQNELNLLGEMKAGKDIDPGILEMIESTRPDLVNALESLFAEIFKISDPRLLRAEFSAEYEKLQQLKQLTIEKGERKS